MSGKNISLNDVQHMASLARLNVNDETAKLFAAQFADILSYMDTLAHEKTDDVEPLYSPVWHEGMLREDVAQNRATRGDVLSNSPKEHEQYFVVPRIV